MLPLLAVVFALILLSWFGVRYWAATRRPERAARKAAVVRIGAPRRRPLAYAKR
jgi:hypothetical protein